MSSNRRQVRVGNGLDNLPRSFAAAQKRIPTLDADVLNQLETAAASITTSRPLSDASSDADSDDELLMDIEVRTSGPASGLITNKTELKDDDEDEEEINHLQTGSCSKFSRGEVVAYTEDRTERDEKEASAFSVSTGDDSVRYVEKGDENNDNLDLSVFFNCSNSISKQNLAEKKTVANFDETKEICASSRSLGPITNSIVDGSYDIIQGKNEFKQASNNLASSSLTEVFETTLLEREIGTNNSNVNLHESIEPESHLTKPSISFERNGYKTGEFPRLKQMLTAGLVSDATMKFTKAMAMDNYHTQGQIHTDTSTFHTDVQNAFMSSAIHKTDVALNKIQVKNGHSNIASFKRQRVDESNTFRQDSLPPKKIKYSSTQDDFCQQNAFPTKYSNLNGNQAETRQTDDIRSIAGVMSQQQTIKDKSACSTRQCPQRVPPPAPLLPPCRVCGEKASGFHYGVNTCEACKGFFRRSLCRKEPYVCVNIGSCEIQSGRRTICSHCRLKRCLDVGMSKNAIKTGRYTHELRSKNIMEVKQLQQQREGGINSMVSETLLPQLRVSVPTPANPCGTENGEKLQGILDILMMAQTYLFEFLDDYYDADLILKRQMEVYNRYKQEKFDRMRNRANTLPGHVETTTNEYNRFLSRDLGYTEDVTVSDSLSDNGKGQVIRSCIEDMERGIQGLVMFAKTVPGFVDLDVDDQSAILKCSRFDIWYIGHIRCLNSNLRVGACEWYFHAEELEQVWGQKLVDMCFRLTDYGQKLNLTREETAALRAVSLTFPDRCILKDRRAVEDIHAKMFEVFQYVASKRHPNFYKWLPDVINFLVYLRDFGIEFDYMSSQMNIEWPVIQKNPLLLEVFFS